MANDGLARLKSGFFEYKKIYMVWDATGRLTTSYEAPSDAEDGKPCIKTTYEYDGDSNRVVKMKEEDALWDSDWDIS